MSDIPAHQSLTNSARCDCAPHPCARIEDLIANPFMLYIHVPFCHTRCAYCAFESVSVPSGDSGHFKPYLDAIKARILEIAALHPRPLLSLYVGGGTPSVLGDSLSELIAYTLTQLQLDPGGEVTVEANPESLTGSLIDKLVEVGVTRFSLGVQSFDEKALHYLGRRACVGDVRRSLALLRERHLDFSIDLIAGIPGVDEPSWRATLQEALNCGAHHIAVYPLSVEEGTPLASLIGKDIVPPPDDDIQADALLMAQRLLTHAGFEHYEIAAYARPGHRARHNVGYWTGVPYLGLGPSAASYVPWVHDECEQRFVLDETIDDCKRSLHQAAQKPAFIEELDASSAAHEALLLTMRLLQEGAHENSVEQLGVTSTFESMAAQGLVEKREKRWRIHGDSWLVANEIFQRLLS